MFRVLRFMVGGLGFMVICLGFSGFRVYGLGFMVQCSGSYGLWFCFEDLGVRV